MSMRAFKIAILVGVLLPMPLFAAEATTSLSVAPITIAVQLTGSQVSYGDLVDYDQNKGIYTLSQHPDDSEVYGVVIQNAPVIFLADPSDIPLARSGTVLVNVTLENGPIKPGDGIIASAIPGKGMRAASSSAHIIGVAREAFAGTGSTTKLVLNGKEIPAGTIAVEIGSGLSSALGTGSSGAGSAGEGCTTGTVVCTVLQKINAAPLVTLMRYIIAAIVAMGSLYLAFRSFMADAINGVISVGRNPRAKTAIQAMVVFNAVLAGVIAVAGLGAGLLILFIQL